MKYLFTVMENVDQFSRSIGNSVFNLFFSMISFSDSGRSIIFKLCTCIQQALNNKQAKFQQYLKKIDTLKNQFIKN